MHVNEMVSKTLTKIIVTIVSEYPEETMWSLIGVVKSNNVARAYKGQEVLGKLKVLFFKWLVANFEGRFPSHSRGSCPNWTTDHAFSRCYAQIMQLRNHRETSYRESKQWSGFSHTVGSSVSYSRASSIKSHGYPSVA
jgi:hypothetical protein